MYGLAIVAEINIKTLTKSFRIFHSITKYCSRFFGRELAVKCNFIGPTI